LSEWQKGRLKKPEQVFQTAFSCFCRFSLEKRQTEPEEGGRVGNGVPVRRAL